MVSGAKGRARQPPEEKECNCWRVTSKCECEGCIYKHECKFCDSTEHGSGACPDRVPVKNFTCETCNLTLAEASYKGHMKGKRHAEAVRQADLAKRGLPPDNGRAPRDDRSRDRGVDRSRDRRPHPYARDRERDRVGHRGGHGGGYDRNDGYGYDRYDRGPPLPPHLAGGPNPYDGRDRDERDGRRGGGKGGKGGYGATGRPASSGFDRFEPPPSGPSGWGHYAPPKGGAGYAPYGPRDSGPPPPRSAYY